MAVDAFKLGFRVSGLFHQHSEPFTLWVKLLLQFLVLGGLMIVGPLCHDLIARRNPVQCIHHEMDRVPTLEFRRAMITASNSPLPVQASRSKWHACPHPPPGCRPFCFMVWVRVTNPHDVLDDAVVVAGWWLPSVAVV